MKRLAGLIILSLIFLVPLFACSPSQNNSSAPLGVPQSVRQPQPLDLGDVTMAIKPYVSYDTKNDRCAQILQAVENRISQQRNIQIKLKLKRVENCDSYAISCAAGVGAEIVLGYNNGMMEKRMPSMQRLNESIEKYGPYLRSKIPDEIWTLNQIGDNIVSIPVLRYYTLNVPVVNISAMERNGWSIPTTKEEFEALLQKAKLDGLRPIEGDTPVYAPEWFGVDLHATAWQDDSGKLHAPTDAPEYETFVNTMRQWNLAGYFQASPTDKQGDYLNDGNWLFGQSDPNTLHLEQNTNIEPLPMITMGSTPPIASEQYFFTYLFRSYHKPEALVTLMDWMYESVENHALIALGIQNSDYQINKSGSYTLLNDPFMHYKFDFQWYLNMDGFDGQPMQDCTNMEAVQKALNYQREARRPTHYLMPLPLGILMGYALPGTSLYQQLKDYFSNTQPSIDDSLYNDRDFVNGKISWAEERQRLDKLAEQSQLLLNLLQTIQDKTYDPLQDMLQPAGVPSN